MKTILKNIIKLAGTALCLFIFLTQTSNALANTQQIYPYNNSSGPAWQYKETWTTCDGGKTACYDSDMSLVEGDNMFHGEADGTQTYKQTGGGWWGGGAGSCCQADDWHALLDDTRNYPNQAAPWVQQRIKIPDSIGKISRVKFYQVYSYHTASVGLQLTIYNAAGSVIYTSDPQVITNGPAYGYQYGLQDALSFGPVEFNPNVAVSPGATYIVRLSRTDGGQVALPVTSPCGAPGGSCKWWISWGGIQEKTTEAKTPHSGTDAYPDGYAESPSPYFDYLSLVGGARKADAARMAVWGEAVLILNNASCVSMAAPDAVTAGQTFTASIWMNNTGTTTWSRGTNYNSGSWDPMDNRIWGSNRAYLDNGVSVAPGSVGMFTFSATAPSTPGTYAFDWWMVQDGVEWFGSPAFNPILPCKKNIIVNPPAPPDINRLTVDNGATPTVTGTYKISGIQASEGGGGGWLNPIDVSLSGTAYGVTATGTTNTIKNYYVAFYNQSLRLASSFNDVNTKINNDPTQGIMLAYGQPLVTGDSGNSNYYVWDKCSSGWKNINNYGPNGFNITNCANTTYFVVRPGSGVKWRVNIQSVFGSKALYTAAQVTDGNNQTVFRADLSPIQTP